MSSDGMSIEYKGETLPTLNWIFHPGTLPAQILPTNVSAINTSTDVVTASGHGLANGDPIRFGVISGDIPVPLSKDVKYYAGAISGATFKVYAEVGLSTLIDLTSAGSGQLIVWKAHTGFDDPVQGLPTMMPEVGTCFSGISYVEIKFPTNRSSASEEPDWQDLRIIGMGRKLMDYNSSGAEVGIVATNSGGLLSNAALQIADNYLVNFIGKNARIDWASWYALRTASQVLIWQRLIASSDPAAPSGFMGRYYSDESFGILAVTRADGAIDFNFGTSSPAPGVPATHYSIRWTGTVIPLYSELYTLSFSHDDTLKVYINGVKVLDKPAWITYGTYDTVDYQFTANTAYEVVVELTQGVGGANCKFAWQSASQAFQVVPTSAVTPTDEQVRRYECHIAFPSPTEASDVHEKLMLRCPGWDWTDDQGLIKFLAPDRATSFAFKFDKIDDDSKPNFEKHTLVKKRRSMVDRKNFLLFRFRNIRNTGYPFVFTQSDRPDLRKFTNGEPTNDPYEDLGVMTRSLAERMAEMRMVINTDPDHTMNLSGARASSIIRKCHFVTVSYYDNNGNYVADAKYMITFHAWGARNEKNDFVLLPVPTPYYTDEPVPV